MAKDRHTRELLSDAEWQLNEFAQLDTLVTWHLRVDRVVPAGGRRQFIVDAGDLLGMFTTCPSMTVGLVRQFEAEITQLIEREQYERAANIHWLAQVLRRMGGLKPSGVE